ncbi:hypothetical protein DI272_00360 [Streptomyces sp. Act143]|nr:hypothetical protein DI272_00360 [Streptomyces sp. Act143]
MLGEDALTEEASEAIGFVGLVLPRATRALTGAGHASLVSSTASTPLKTSPMRSRRDCLCRPGDAARPAGGELRDIAAGRRRDRTSPPRC